MTSPQSLMSPSFGPKSPSSFMDSPIPALPTVPSIPIPPSRYPIAADTYHSHYSGSLSSSYAGSHSDASNTQDESKGYSPQPDAFNTYPLYNWSYKQHQVMPVQPPAQIPPLSFYYRPHRLEEIAPRDTISLIIALFFDFVYPLTPCVHKPSFMADLHAHREERDPLFFALVMSTVASTLVQVPRSYLPMDRPVVRKLAQVRALLSVLVALQLKGNQTCHEASRQVSIASYDPPTSMHVIIRYLFVPFSLFI